MNKTCTSFKLGIIKRMYLDNLASEGEASLRLFPLLAIVREIGREERDLVTQIYGIFQYREVVASGYFDKKEMRHAVSMLNFL